MVKMTQAQMNPISIRVRERSAASWLLVKITGRMFEISIIRRRLLKNWASSMECWIYRVARLLSSLSVS